jgi:hypothetical protein
MIKKITSCALLAISAIGLVIYHYNKPVEIEKTSKELYKRFTVIEKNNGDVIGIIIDGESKIEFSIPKDQYKSMATLSMDGERCLILSYERYTYRTGEKVNKNYRLNGNPALDYKKC